MKKLILILLLLVGISYGQKQSLYSQYPGLVFKESFNDEYSTRANGGVPTAVTYSNGSAVCVAGNSSKIVFSKPLRGIYTIRIRFKSLNPVNGSFFFDANSRDLGNSGSISTTPTSITSSGYVDGVNYVDGVPSSTISTSTKEIVVSGVGLRLSSFFINCRFSSTVFNTATYDLIEIYNRALSASEIKNLYDGVAHKDLPANQAEVLGSVTYTSDFSANTDGWSNASCAITANVDGIGGRDNNLSIRPTDTGGTHYALRNNLTTSGLQYEVSFDYYCPSTNTQIDTYQLKGYGGFAFTTAQTITTFDTWVTYTTRLTTSTAGFYLYISDGYEPYNPNGTDIIYIRNFTVKPVFSASTPLLIDFSSVAGQIKDLRGNTITNTATTIKRAGSIFSADFNGTTSKLDFGNIDALTGDITICGWVKARSDGEANVGRVIDNGKVQIIKYNTGRYLFYSDGGSTTAQTANNSITYNKWCFICVTRTSNGITNFYIGTTTLSPIQNGTINQSSGTPASGTTNIIIGNNSAQTTTFNGLIPFLRVYKSLLSINQITQIWQSTANQYVGD